MREPNGRKTSNILLLIIVKIQLHTLSMKRDDTLWKSILEDIFEDFDGRRIALLVKLSPEFVEKLKGSGPHPGELS